MPTSRQKKPRRRSSVLTSGRVAARRPRLPHLLILLAGVVLVAAITEFPAFRDPSGKYEIDREPVASRDVIADFAFQSTDLAATQEKREKAAAAEPVTYSVDGERVRNQLLTLVQRINTLTERREEVAKAVREALLASTSEQPAEAVVREAVTALAARWKSDPLFEGFPEAPVLSVWLMPHPDSIPTREFETEPTTVNADGNPTEARRVTALIEPKVSPLQYQNLELLTNLAREGLDYVLTAGVVTPGNVRVGEGSQAPKVQILRGRVLGDLQVSKEVGMAELPDAAAARERLRQYVSERVQALQAQEPDSGRNWELISNAAFEMAAANITDTLGYDQVVTEGNRETARANVEPVMTTIERGQYIQEAGHRWTQQTRSDAKAYWSKFDAGGPTARTILAPLVSNILLVSLVLVGLIRSLPILIGPRRDLSTAVNAVLLIMTTTVVLARVVTYFDPTGFVVPSMAGAILLAILFNARLAALAGLLTVLLVSALYDQNWRLLVVESAMCFAGVSTLYAVRKRSDMARASIAGTIVGLIAVLAVMLANDSVFSWVTLNRLMLIGLNGAACLFLVPGLLSPLEKLFGITTDIQLLEYSDLNNELLSRLAIEVPATYAHSLMMGQLAEAAADAIGANGLMARVCAYYHDIGKLRRPDYFSENQMGYNIHEDLSPRLSARAIASHVLEGVEIAREYHLPKPIIDGIREHHGTMLISFFYQQALEQQKHGDVREADFRYGGPKPQSRETAILMICDGVESGVRSIKNPNEDRVRDFIDKIIQTRAEDRQFDECDLTLKDLDLISDVIARRVVTSLHTRVAYPDPRPSVAAPAPNVIPMSGSRD